MAHRAFKRGAGAITQRRLTSWFQFIPTLSAMGGGGVTLVFSLNAAALALRPFTIVRSRFLLQVTSDQSAALEQQVAAVGMAIVSDQAVAIGVTAVPTPLTDLGSDLWFFHQLLYATESTLPDNMRPGGVFEVDSKAMRKVDIGQDLVIVAEVSSTVGGGAITTIGGRMLVKVN